MKKHLSFLTALLLLLSLAACGTAPAKDEQSPDNSGTQTGSEAQPDGRPTESSGTFTPVTTEEEVRALYAADPDPFPPENLTITPYEGDFLVQIDRDTYAPMLDWVYGQSGIRRRMLFLYEPLLNCEIQGQASVEVVTGGPNNFNGVPGFPHVENVSLSLVYDEQGMPLNYDAYGSGATSSSDTYWAGAGESYYMGMQGRREAVRSAQIDAGGVTVAFAPLADGSDFVAAYCEIPYTEVALSEDGMTLTVTMHDTFLSSGTLSRDVDLDFLKEYGSLYPESFPAGELAGSCTLIENADLRQDGNNAVLTVTLADGPIHGRNFGDGYYRFTAETGYTGIADTGPYLRVTLNATNELFAGD